MNLMQVLKLIPECLEASICSVISCGWSEPWLKVAHERSRNLEPYHFGEHGGGRWPHCSHPPATLRIPAFEQEDAYQQYFMNGKYSIVADRYQSCYAYIWDLSLVSR